jgi:hypothetical protein
VDVFKQLDIVSIVDMYSNEHRAGCIEGLTQGWCNFIGLLNLEAGGAEGFGVLDVIHRTKIHSRRAVVLNSFLCAHHVVVAIDPNHVNQMGIQITMSNSSEEEIHPCCVHSSPPQR